MSPREAGILTKVDSVITAGHHDLRVRAQHARHHRDLQQGGLRADLCLTLLDAVEGLLLSWVVFEHANEANWGFGPVEPSEHPHLAISIKFRSPGTYRLFQSIDALIMGFEKLNAMAG